MITEQEIITNIIFDKGLVGIISKFETEIDKSLVEMVDRGEYEIRFLLPADTHILVRHKLLEMYKPHWYVRAEIMERTRKTLLIFRRQ